jgi:putative oxidoreductase
MKILAIVCRVLLGLVFVVFGLNILHPFMPVQPMPEQVNAFMAIMAPSGWLKAIGAFQVLGGLLVLYSGTVPLGLVILCPITVNILLFHLCLMGGSGILPGILTAIFELILISRYRANFAGILTAQA